MIKGSNNKYFLFPISKLSLEPLGVPVIDEALKQVPWWITNLGFIIIAIKNIHFLYVKFEKWCKKFGI